MLTIQMEISLVLFLRDLRTSLPRTQKNSHTMQCHLGQTGLATSSGHSFRIGRTTEFLLSGVPPDIVKALGRWSFDSFLCYWRSPDFLHLCMQKISSISGLPCLSSWFGCAFVYGFG
ncbi:hypothetical protein BD769DRAFT_1416683 [Suillus cothurnatus]|nr:hypothetical protein BD769DRAFT_1416683 [Suillus cothurnatus]